MKSAILIFALAMGLSVFSFAQTATPVATPVVAVTPAVSANPASVTTPVPVVAAPPQWATDVLVSAESLPVIGPILVKGLMYFGIITTLLTSLVAFLLGFTATLSGTFNAAGLTKFATLLTDFQNGKIMYWLKFITSFNAQKPATPVANVAVQDSSTKAAA
jgi:hypothetical protein